MNHFCQKILGFIGFASLSLTALHAQDARYSQYYTAPLRVNPALIGVFDGTYRVGLNYRTQWGAILGKAYNTYAVTADARIALPSKDFIGVGFSAATDKAGLPGYTATDLNVGISYMKKLSSGGRKFYRRGNVGSYLVAGGQVGLVQRGVNWENYTFSTQYQVSDNTYNQGIYSGESPNVRQNKLSADLNAGVAWYGVFGKRKSAYAGLGIYHINRPDISVFNDPPRDSAGNVVGTSVERLYTRFTAHAGGEVLVGKSGLSLMPGAVLMFQGPSTELNFGLSLRYQEARNDDFAFKFGVWSRISKHVLSGVRPDALMILVGMDFQQFHVGLSYDATISSLSQQVNGRGALEFSLMYIIDTDQRQRQGCPAFN
jgi:type IX secretion system PorP/SprF family membrane protein